MTVKTGRKQEGLQGHAVTELLMKNVKMDIKKSFLDVMSEVQKDSQDGLAGIGQLKKNPTNKNFVWN
jgi:hypothetical protein